jgi:1,4-dihydroxy-2-naphthoate octaprenyltransferase
MVEFVCKRDAQLKIETNGHGMSIEKAERLQRLGVKAVQFSLDGASRETFNRMRVRGDFDLAIEGIRNLHAAGVPIEINYSPTMFNVHEIGQAVDLAYQRGACSFYTDRTMYTGNAVKTWHRLAPAEAQYATFFEVLHQKSREYRGRMRVYFHELGLLEELRYRLQHPAALLIVLPNGLVKLVNALPFVCGDLRRQSLEEIWANFLSAWKDPNVARFILSVVGVAAFAGALAVGVYLAAKDGWPILAFALLGGLAAIFYVAPPIRCAYRGLGETVIALSYGPWLVLGSLYLQTRGFSWGALCASLVPGFLIMALAVVNAIPDFQQDRLVGKRNLVVRLGRRRAVPLYLSLAAAGLLTVMIGVLAGLFPLPCLAALLALPLLVISARRAARTYESPRQFVPAIRSIVSCYMMAVCLFTAGVVLHAWR